MRYGFLGLRQSIQVDAANFASTSAAKAWPPRLTEFRPSTRMEFSVGTGEHITGPADMIERLAIDALRTPPMPYRLLKLAEVGA